MTRPTPATQHDIVDAFASGNMDQLRKRLADQAEGLAAAVYDREGGQASDHSDPTYQKATRPTGAGRDELLGFDNLVKLYWAAMEGLERLRRNNTPDAKQRPTAARGACLGGVQHYPADDGLRCAHKACAKPWPCHPGETESKFVECTGRIDPVSNRCMLCELHADSMVCKDCAEVKSRADERSHQCGACRKAQQRAKEAA